MSVQTFSDLNAMSQHQRTRELDEALRVRSLPTAAFSIWLRRSLDPLQKLVGPTLEAENALMFSRVRHFRSEAEKQRYEEQMELQRALHLALSRQGHA